MNILQMHNYQFLNSIWNCNILQNEKIQLQIKLIPFGIFIFESYEHPSNA